MCSYRPGPTGEGRSGAQALCAHPGGGCTRSLGRTVFISATLLWHFLTAVHPKKQFVIREVRDGSRLAVPVRALWCLGGL